MIPEILRSKTKKGQNLSISRHYLMMTNNVCRSVTEQQYATLISITYFFLKTNSLVSATSLIFPGQNPWLTKVLLPWTSYFVPTMWTLDNAKTDFDRTIFQKVTRNSLKLNSKSSTKVITDFFDRY